MYPQTVAHLVCSSIAFLWIALAAIPQIHRKPERPRGASTKVTIAERIGILCQAFWLCGGCLLFFVNGMVWRHDSVNRAPLLCDISEWYSETLALCRCFNIWILMMMHDCYSHLLLRVYESRHRLCDVVYHEEAQRLAKDAAGRRTLRW